MVTKVRVKDFQSIREAEIDIDGLTVVTGPNNTGKSALLRAIKGVFQNTRGNAFVRHGAKKCSVELRFGDGRTVKWEKGAKTKPTYVIDGGKPLHPGQGIPEEVKALGVRSIPAGGREVWPQVAPQLNGQVFLLDEPGSVLAEAVANVDRVGRLNRSLKASEKDRRSASSTLKVRLLDEKRLRDELAAFEGLDEIKAEVEAVEKISLRAHRVAGAAKILRALKVRLEAAQGEVETLEGIEGVEVPDTQAARESWNQVVELRSLQEERAVASALVAQFDGIGRVEVDVDETHARRVVRGLKTLRDLKSRFSSARDQVRSLTMEVETTGSELHAAEHEVQEVLGDLGECPTCGTVVENTG